MKKLVFLITLWTVFCWLQPVQATTQKHAKTTVKTVAKKHQVSKKRHKRLSQWRKKRKKYGRKAKRRVSLPPVIHGEKQLATVINKIVKTDAGKAQVSVYVKSMTKDDRLYRKNIYLSLVPASTLKIFTAEAALLYLGSDYRFSTQILTDANEVKDGVLQGNLYIVLSGDPSLKYEYLVDLIATIKDRDIRAIAGNVYIDDTAYDKRFYGPGWEGEDKDYCYAAPIGASIINHNCIPFQMKPAKVAGRKAKLVKSPKYFYPKMHNSVVTKKRRSRSCGIRVNKEPGSPLSLEGCLSRGRRNWGMSYVVTDLPEYNRSLFKSLLKKQHIKVYGSVTFGAAPDDLEYIAMHSSEPLEDLIKKCSKNLTILLLERSLKSSVNFIVEDLEAGKMVVKRSQAFWGAKAVCAYIQLRF